MAQSFEPVPQDVPGFVSASLSWGDFDSDGDLDLLIGGGTSAGHQTLLYRNDAGALVPGPFVGLSGFTGATAWADFDGDGDLDFASGGFTRFPDGPVFPPLSARIFRNDGEVGFVALGSEINTSGVVYWSDFDRDGDVDLLIAGADNAEPASADLDLRRLRIYVNDPGQPWRLGWEHILPANSRLPLVEDWDKDGWPDIVYPYNRMDDSKGLVFQRNMGGLKFEASEADFSGYAWPYFMDWGDVDNDGDMDAAFTGEIGLTRVLKLVRNDAGTSQPYDIAGVGGIAIAWADFDGDGRLDLSTTEGSDGAPGSFLRLHRNTGADATPAFEALDLPFRGAGFSSLSWADFDGDGDPDLAVTGFTNQVPSFRLFRNFSTVSNPPPTVPTGLGSTPGSGGSVELKWSASTDSNQPGGLTYNLRVGRSPGGVDVLPPEANLQTGRLLVPRRGSAGTLEHQPLTNLVAGTYWWSVQAVDNGYAASSFAPEASFVIPPGAPRIRNLEVSEVRFRHARFAADVLPDGAAGRAWFEYGEGEAFDQATAGVDLGDGVEWLATAAEIEDLLTEVDYRFRLVVSNSVGVSVSGDRAFRIANTAPTISAALRISTFPDRASAPASIVVADVETPPGELQLKAEIVVANGQNANLLTPAGVVLGGTGGERTLTLTPQPDQRGAVGLLLTVTDANGGKATRPVTFTVEAFSLQLRLGANPGARAEWGDVDGDGRLDLIGSQRWYYNEKGTNLSGQTATIPNQVVGPVALGDVDRDGRVDFVVSGSRAGQQVTQIYTNRPFTAPTTHLFRGVTPALTPGFLDAALGWADADGYGDVDLLGFGLTNVQPIAAFALQAWRNDGGLQFAPMVTGLPKLALGGMAWADFDGDGDMDVCLLGSTNRASSGAFTGLFRNDGSGGFTSEGVSLPRLFRGFADWGDVDNDGRPDLLLGGTESLANGRSTNRVGVFRQTANGTFELWKQFEPLLDTQGHLADLDNDGRLDVIYMGSDVVIGVSKFIRIYLQRDQGFVDASPTSQGNGDTISLGDFDGDGDLDFFEAVMLWRNNSAVSNSIPSAPTALASQTSSDHVVLSWAEATDANQKAGLTYNLRVGRKPGGIDVVSPLANPATGVRHVVAAGNASESRQWMIRGLASGTYYWSVQAVDHAMAGGAFAAEKSFEIGASAPPRFIGAVITEGGEFELTAMVEASGRHVLEGSPDLAAWSEDGTYDLAAGSATIRLAGVAQPQRFFRLRRVSAGP